MLSKLFLARIVICITFPLISVCREDVSGQNSETFTIEDSSSTPISSSIVQERPFDTETFRETSEFKREEDVCGVGETKCPFRNSTSGDFVCYKSCEKCDGIVHCPEATDEIKCPCKFKLKSTYICDGTIDCSDYSDELGCGKCSRDELTCGRDCVSLTDFCRGRRDCFPFNRALVCSRLTQKQFEDSAKFTYRSKGYLQVLTLGDWVPVCWSSGPEVNHTITQYCQEVTGVSRAHPSVKLEEKSSQIERWSVLKSGPNRVIYNSDVHSCPHGMVVYVECPPPPCQNTKTPSPEGPKMVERIVGGSEADSESWSFVVRVRKNGLHHCGGSVITPRWVLSASHCFLRISGEFYEVESGTDRGGTFGPNTQRKVVSYVIRHPDFDPYTMKNDVALLRLKNPLDVNRWTRPVCLFDGNLDVQEGSLCFLAGWGYRSEEGNLAEKLQETELPILRPEICVREFIYIDPEKIICSGHEDGNRDSCQGDSGGPMMCKVCPTDSQAHKCEGKEWYQMGIVSYGRGCARPGVPGVYTKITRFTSWIFQTIDLVENNSTTLPSIVPKTICEGVSCVHSTGLCLNTSLACDGKVDCLDAQDETKCEVNGTNVEEQNYDYDLYYYVEKYYEYYDDTNTSPTDESISRNVNCPENHYQCEVIPGCVPNYVLCDGTRNCRDGTDELRCTCVDRLFLTHRNKICDGIHDCVDYTDEFCKLCEEGNWLCWRSAQCVETKRRCDSIPDCRYGEDELHCLTLSPAEGHLVLGEDGHPLTSNEGYLLLLTPYPTLTWDPVCEESMDEEIAAEICLYLGYGHPLSIKYNSNLPPKYEIRGGAPRRKRSSTLLESKHDFQFSGRGLAVDGVQMENFGREHVSNILERGRLLGDLSPLHHMLRDEMGSRKKRMTCSQVRLECGEKLCGKVQSLHFSNAPPLGDASHVPWAVNIFSSGTHLCDGTLVGLNWVLSSSRCFQLFNFSGEELYVMGGSYSPMLETGLMGPYDVSIRVDAATQVDDQSGLILLHLEDSVENIAGMNAVCLEERTEEVKWKECLMVGHTKFDLSMAFLLIPKEENCTSGRMCFEKYLPYEDLCVNSWSGLIACREERSSKSPWTGVAVWEFHSDLECKKPPGDYLKLTTELVNKIQIAMSKETKFFAPVSCDGQKCPLGACVPNSKMCDAEVSCPDISDEPPSCPVPVQTCKYSQATESCECPFKNFKCSDGICLDPRQVCDGQAQCSSGEDEVDCKCSVKSEAAQTEGEQLCNGVIDCKDQSDEINCGCNLKNEFRCFRAEELNCISKELVCDGVADCMEGEDEAYCFTISMTISPEENALGIPDVSVKGYLLLRVKGRWYTYNSSLWESSNSGGVCSSLGFSGVLNTTSKPIDISALTVQPRNILPGSSDGELAVYLECSK